MQGDGVTLTEPALELPGWRHVSSGKVRDLYVPLGSEGSPQEILLVASDRISAYDVVLPTLIPDKGRVLTALTAWWFDQLKDVVPSHLVSLDVPAPVAGRGMICRRLDMFPVECVARGYLTGSGLKDYQASGSVCGIELPPGLVDASRLPEAIFTPATKAEQGEHDENVAYDAVVQTVGAEDAAVLRDLTLELYSRAEVIARERGVILADTKFEFGRDPVTGAITLGDEVLTPDSSRFWPADSWSPGTPQPSFDKQFVRDWLVKESGWRVSSGPPAPELPPDIVDKTRGRYLEAYRLLTGQEL
ncbi:MAG: phosphoribosylaminoimidazolesuccinocarboxamide synthase [Micrococcales bacterium]|nr:phosphoribosylaminoimidazolesuccinocarboxamide synthase [Micrococcales bacterium]